MIRSKARGAAYQQIVRLPARPVPAPQQNPLKPLSLRKFARLVAASAVLVPFATCSDFTGPSSGRGAQIPVIPTFSPAATFARALYSAAGLEFDRVRVIITRGETVLKDTTVAFGPTSAELSLPLVISAVPGEVVKATLQYATASMVLYEGSSSVTTIGLSAPAPTPTPVVLVPVGPGSTAETVQISPNGGNFPVTGAVNFTAQAFATGGTAITNPVFGWSVDDATVASVDAHGVVQPTTKGGAAKVRATTLNGKFAEASVTFVTAPASLAVQSGGGQSALAFEPLPANVVVKVLDGNGNGVPGAAVTFAVAAGGGSIEVVNATSDASGLVAVKWALGGDVGTQSITATATALPNAPITINATATERPAKTLVFGQQPTKSLMGAAIMPAVTVKALDDHGRVVTGFTDAITIAFDANPGSATLGGTLTTSAVAGLATFADLSVSAAGKAYKIKAGNAALAATVISDAFDVDQVPSGLSLFAGGAQTAAIRTQLAPIAVKVADANGIGVAGVTVAFDVLTGGGTLVLDNGVTDAGGIARVKWTLGDVVGAQSIRATSAGLAGSPLTITATATPLPVAGLAFVQGPSNVQMNTAMSPAVTVRAVNADGQTVTTFTGNVELTLLNNPNSATLGGTTTIAAVNGIATFSNLTVNVAGSGYALKAASGTLATATSGTFVVSPPPAVGVAFDVQPSNTVSGTAITPAMTVRIVDANGNTVPGATNVVTLSKAVPLQDFGLFGTLTATAVNGVATFANVTVNSPGTGFTLKATAEGLIQGTSAAFNITAAPPPTRTWQGTTSADWNTAENWNPVGVPTSADSVVIPAAANPAELAGSATARVVVIQSGGELRVNVSTVILTADKVVNLGKLYLNAGFVNSDIVNKSWFYAYGSVSANNVQNESGATTRITGGIAGSVLNVQHLFTNDGTLELTDVGGASASLSVGDSVVNKSGGMISVPNGNSGTRTISGVLRNHGAVNVASSRGLSVYQSNTGGLNDGTITFTGGGPFTQAFGDTTMTFVNNGIIALNSSAWEVVSGHLQVRAPGTVTGTGLFLTTQVQLDVDLARLPLRMQIDLFTLFAGDSIVVPTSVLMQLQGSTIAQKVVVLGTLKTLLAEEGPVGFQNELSIKSGGVVEAQGNAAVEGTLSIATGGTLRVVARDEDRSFSVGSSFTNAGTIELTSTGTFQTKLHTGGTLTNDGTIHAIRGGLGAGGERAIEGVLDNRATITVDADSYLTLYTNSTDNKNSGTINLPSASAPDVAKEEHVRSFTISRLESGGWLTNTGTISIGSNRTFFIDVATQVNNANGGVIEGIGTLRKDAEATFNNSGTIAPGGVGKVGTLTMDGTWSVGSGTLDIDVGGVESGTFDMINQVSGSATMSGTLHLGYLNDFVPNSQTLIPLPGNCSGSFEVVDPGDLQNHYCDGGLRLFFRSQALDAQKP